jgi:transcriptional regulator with XRE-family HTH domain
MASVPAFENARRNLAANLARFRAAHRWSQQQAADAVGIDLKHLQKLEYAALNPTLRTVVAAERLLACRWRDYFANRPGLQ